MLSAQQKDALRQLLLIEDFAAETIYGIVGRMETIGAFLRQHHEYKNILPFHETYYLVTKRIADTYVEQPHYFLNRASSEHLDIIFASLYFKPLYLFLTEDKLSTPWQTFFEYCEHPHGTAFVQMLLGINAHINADLVSAMKKAKYTEEKDFMRINDILLFEMPHVMRYLAFADHDFFAISGMIFLKKFMVEEFQNVIVKWRQDAWKNYQENIDEKTLAVKTESLGKTIIHTFDHLISENGIAGATAKINLLSL